MMTIREALLAMSYTEKQPNKWLKPVGYHLFVSNEVWWENWFLNGQDKLNLYSGETFIEGDPLRQLKGFEAWTRISIDPLYKSTFHLDAFDI